MPAIAPMIAGVAFANAINKSAEKDASLDLWGSLWKGTTAGLDVIMDLPLLQSTQEIFKPKKDADGNDMSLATRAFNVFIGNWPSTNISLT